MEQGFKSLEALNVYQGAGRIGDGIDVGLLRLNGVLGLEGTAIYAEASPATAVASDGSGQTAVAEQAPQAGTLTIGDRSYPIDKLSDEAQKLVFAVHDCEGQIVRLKREVDYLNVAHRTLIQELTSRLPD